MYWTLGLGQGVDRGRQVGYDNCLVKILKPVMLLRMKLARWNINSVDNKCAELKHLNIVFILCNSFFCSMQNEGRKFRFDFFLEFKYIEMSKQPKQDLGKVQVKVNLDLTEKAIFWKIITETDGGKVSLKY